MYRLLIVLSLLLLAFTPCAHAQDATEVVSSYFDALQNGDWEEAASHFDPAALKTFRQTMSFMTKLPSEAKSAFISMFFSAGASEETIASLSDSAFFAEFHRTLVTNAHASGGVSFGDVEVLGQVMEGAEVAHVLTRSTDTLGEGKVESMEVVSAKKTKGVWKLLLPPVMEELASDLSAGVEERSLTG